MTPRISVHLMAMNAASVLPRLLLPLRGQVDEVCLVDTGSRDDTVSAVASLASEIGVELRCVAFSPSSRSDLYFYDSPGSFRRAVPGPFTGLPVLRDWSAARNVGLDLCGGDVVLKLDADDEVLHPQNLRDVVASMLEHPGVDVLMCPREVVDPTTRDVDRVEMYSRLWRRLPELRFREACHENVDWYRRADAGGSNYMMLRSGLAVRDHGDLVDAGTRVPRRNLKVLLRELERLEAAGEVPSAHLAIYLADEAADSWPELAREAVGLLCLASMCPVDQDWVHLILGRAAEAEGDLRRAASEYELAAQHGSARAVIRRALVEHRLGDLGWHWQAYARRGIEASRGRYYPSAATLAEVREAERLLREDEGTAT